MNYIAFSDYGHVDPYSPDSVHSKTQFSSVSGENFDSLNEDIPIIMWWKRGDLNSKGVYPKQCPNSRCYITYNEALKDHNQTRAFMFYGTDFDPEKVPLPRRPWHEWVLFHEESPQNNYILVHGPTIRLFNHTSTFRRESDYPLPSHSLPSLSYLTDRKPVSLETKNDLKNKQGLAPVLYVQSHCDVPMERDNYVKELMKYIPVDSYGKCVHNKDLPKHLINPVKSMQDADFFDILANYKFHIAFENAMCKDYMTEKLFRPLHLGSVPIYLGSSYAKEWMPTNHSMILVDDFPSPEELAKYIRYVDMNDHEYEKYLSFKKPNGVTNQFLLEHLRTRGWPNEVDFFTGFECYVCDKITERVQNEKAHIKDPSVALLPPKFADYSHMNCPQPHSILGGDAER